MLEMQNQVLEEEKEKALKKAEGQSAHTDYQTRETDQSPITG